MILLIIKIMDLVNGLVDRFVDVGGYFWKGADGQWVGNTYSDVTAKGNDVIDSLASIIHYGLDFVAQFMSLLPLGNLAAPPGQSATLG